MTVFYFYQSLSVWCLLLYKNACLWSCDNYLINPFVCVRMSVFGACVWCVSERDSMPCDL